MDRIANSRIRMISKMVSEELECEEEKTKIESKRKTKKHVINESTGIECEEADNVFEALRVAGRNPVMATNQQKTPIIQDNETGEVLAKRCGKCLRMVARAGINNQSRPKDGLASKCKECSAIYRNNPARKERQKVCDKKRNMRIKSDPVLYKQQKERVRTYDRKKQLEKEKKRKHAIFLELKKGYLFTKSLE